MLDDELDEDDIVLSVVAGSVVAGGVTATGLGFSGRYSGPLKPQAERHVVMKISEAIRNIATPGYWASQTQHQTTI